ncbi:MAG: hypothetical protein ACKESB_00475 [Candidatus Hodgkinia cicadicola]
MARCFILPFLAPILRALTSWQCVRVEKGREGVCFAVIAMKLSGVFGLG